MTQQHQDDPNGSPVPHLVGVVGHHGLVGHVGHRKNVWRVSRALSADVQLGMLGSSKGGGL